MSRIQVLSVINPDNLPIEKVLVCWGKVIALPRNAVVFHDDEESHSIPHIDVDEKVYKHCSLCGRWLRLRAFYKDATKSDGYVCRCAECINKLKRKRTQRLKGVR